MNVDISTVQKSFQWQITNAMSSYPVPSYDVSDCNFEGIEAAAQVSVKIFIFRSEVSTVDIILRKLNHKKACSNLVSNK